MHLPAQAQINRPTLHAETRRLLSLAVAMPRRTAEIDDALDRWLLHPVLGLLSLAVVMFLIFQAVYAWATPLMDLIEAGTGALGGPWSAVRCRKARSTACWSTASSPASAG